MMQYLTQVWIMHVNLSSLQLHGNADSFSSIREFLPLHWNDYHARLVVNDQ